MGSRPAWKGSKSDGKKTFLHSYDMMRWGQLQVQLLPIWGLWRSSRVLVYPHLGDACPPSLFVLLRCWRASVAIWPEQQQILTATTGLASSYLLLSFLEVLVLPAVSYAVARSFLWLRDSCGYLSSRMPGKWVHPLLKSLGLGWVDDWWQGRWEESRNLFFFLASLLNWKLQGFNFPHIEWSTQSSGVKT